MEWFSYLLKVSACMGLFYAFYYLCLQRLTFFSFNRVFLIGTLLLSFVVPALEFEVEETRVALPVKTEQLQPAIVDEVTGLALSPSVEVLPNPAIYKWQTYNWENLLYAGYAIGALVILAIFLVQIFYLLRHTRNASTSFGRLKVVYKPEGFTNCSFLNYVFVNQEDLSDHEINILLQHESIHASRLHSIDKLLIAFCKVVLWFNPLVYLYDKSLEQVHEYEADKEAALSIGNTSYAQLLLSMAVKKSNLPLVHNFVKNPLKERIKMLFTNQSKNMKKLMYLSCLPLLAILLWSFSISYVYKEPATQSPVIAPTNEMNPLIADTPKYRQKVKRTPQLLAAQKENDEWRKTDQYKSLMAKARKLNEHPLTGTIKGTLNDLRFPKNKMLLFESGDDQYAFEIFGLGDKVVGQMKTGSTVTIKVSTAGVNKNMRYLSISASEITKDNKVIYTRPKPVQSAFLYEANKVRFTDGEITKVIDHSAYEKQIQITANGYKFIVEISRDQVDAKELSGFKEGDPVRLRFVHEVKSGAKSYAIKDWVSISKNIREYGVKNKDMFDFFYEQVANKEKIKFSTSGSITYSEENKITKLENGVVQNAFFLIKADAIKMYGNEKIVYAKNVRFSMPKSASVISGSFGKFNMKDGSYELLKTCDEF